MFASVGCHPQCRPETRGNAGALVGGIYRALRYARKARARPSPTRVRHDPPLCAGAPFIRRPPPFSSAPDPGRAAIPTRVAARWPSGRRRESRILLGSRRSHPPSTHIGSILESCLDSGLGLEQSTNAEAPLGPACELGRSGREPAASTLRHPSFARRRLVPSHGATTSYEADSEQHPDHLGRHGRHPAQRPPPSAAPKRGVLSARLLGMVET